MSSNVFVARIIAMTNLTVETIKIKNNEVKKVLKEVAEKEEKEEKEKMEKEEEEWIDPAHPYLGRGPGLVPIGRSSESSANDP
jgi:hypothetical protein